MSHFEVVFVEFGLLLILQGICRRKILLRMSIALGLGQGQEPGYIPTFIDQLLAAGYITHL